MNPPVSADEMPPAPAPASIVSRAIRASASRRGVSPQPFADADADAYISSGYHRVKPSPPPSEFANYEYTSMENLVRSDTEVGFWGALARKARTILDDHNRGQGAEDNPGSELDVFFSNDAWIHHPKQSPNFQSTVASPKGSESIASSLNHIGGSIKNTFEEGLMIMGNKRAGIIQETRKLQLWRKTHEKSGIREATAFPLAETDHEDQLLASRNVANAMAAKAKLLRRELKTFKADLAFAKERCDQLEEQNKLLRVSKERGVYPEDDELIQRQLETLLAEKSRLLHENANYTRENMFLREVVEYHQLTMQDVVYVNESIEEVAEVYPSNATPQPSPHSVALAQKASYSPATSAPPTPKPDSSPPLLSAGAAVTLDAFLCPEAAA